MATESRPALRRRLRPAGGRGRGPGGPPAYPRIIGEVGVAKGETGGKQIEAAAVRTCEGTAASGGNSGHPGPIRLAGRKRTARRCSSAGRGSRGRHGMAAMDGGRVQSLRLCTGERNREGEREPEGERGKRGAWCAKAAPGGLLVGSATGSKRWLASGSPGAPRTCSQ
jgi:hypothetical protein